MNLKKITGLFLALTMSAMNLYSGFAENIIDEEITVTNKSSDISLANSWTVVSKLVSVKPGNFNDEVYLRIQPAETVYRGDKIRINIENGKFDIDAMRTKNNASADSTIDDMYGYNALGEDFKWNDIMNLYDSNVQEFGVEQGFYQTFNDLMDDKKTVDLPYHLELISDKELEIELCPIPDTYAGEPFAGTNKPVYKIPLPFTAGDSGIVSVYVNSMGTSISSGQNHVIAKIGDSNEDNSDENHKHYGSINKTTKVVSVNDNDFNDEVSLKIQPTEIVERGGKIRINIENGKFDIAAMRTKNNASADATIDDIYGYKALGDVYKWENIIVLYDINVEEFGAEQGFYQTFYDLMNYNRTADLPYHLELISDKELEVELCPIPDTFVGETFAGVHKPRYKIPLPFTAGESGNVKISINSINTYISNDIHTIAQIGNSGEDYEYNGSINNVTKVVSVNDKDFNNGVSLKIQPTETVEGGDKIRINIKNGKFNINDMRACGGSVNATIDDMYGYNALGDEYKWNNIMKRYDSNFENYGFEQGFYQTFGDLMNYRRTVELPYHLELISDKEIEVELCPIPDIYAGETFAGVNKPRYRIPLPFTADGSGNVTVSINSIGTSISSDTHTIAQIGNSGEDYKYNGSINGVNKVISVKDRYFSDEVYLRIQPTETVERGDKIRINIKNGKFDINDMRTKNNAPTDASIDDMYGYNALGDEYKWNDIMELYDNYVEEFGAEQGFYQTFNDLMDDCKTVDLPYHLELISDKELEVELCPIPDTFANETFAGVNKPIYRIPLPFTADGSDTDVGINIDSINTSVSNNSHTIAKIYVPGITIDTDSIPSSINVGEILKIKAYFSLDTYKNVIWTSSNENVAVVTLGNKLTGIVTGVSAGTATITATTKDGNFSAECTITVSGLAPGNVDGKDGITVNDAALVMQYVLTKNTSGFAGEDGIKAAKVTKRGDYITVLDAAAILMKALNPDFEFEIEKDK